MSRASTAVAQISRRDFLKIGVLALGSLALSKYPRDPELPFDRQAWFPEELTPTAPPLRARVTVDSIFIYQSPSYKSDRLGVAQRDTILKIIEELISPQGPAYNPRWYRLATGFVHSGNCQRVELAHLNTPVSSIIPTGQLGEVTVPISQSVRKMPGNKWAQLYRLYYGSVHWITSLEEGPDGLLWYGLTDERLHSRYLVPATHLRLILPDELTPLAAEVPENQKRIEVSIANQIMTAYEGSRVVRQTQIASGTHQRTPTGHYHITVKVPSKHMGDGRLTDDYRAYELPGVPWVAFFHSEGIAFHGTFWHDDFGHMISHGCINLRNEDAKWLYRWTTPTCSANDWYRQGYGTAIDII